MLRALEIDNPVVDCTPIERYLIDGHKVWVKREDLCCPHPGPQFSKIRGLYAHMRKLKEDGVEVVGILDTIHSKAGWAVAYIANILSMHAFVFYPVYKREVGGDYMRHQQRMAGFLGAILVPLDATAGYILAPKAKKMLAQLSAGEGVMLPVGLKLQEAISANVEEAKHSGDLLKHGTWIVSTSSGTIAAALWKAMCEVKSGAQLICHTGYSRKRESLMEYMRFMSGYPIDNHVQFIDENYEYKDKVDYPCPFPCNPYYDLKAWMWLCETANLERLEPPIMFWNIGA